MNELQKRIAIGLLQSCLVAAPVFGLSAGRASAAEPVTCHVPAASTLDARLAARADEGATSLRRFVGRTVTIYGLDVSTAVARADHFREARDSCVAVAERS